VACSMAAAGFAAPLGAAWLSHVVVCTNADDAEVVPEITIEPKLAMTRDPIGTQSISRP